MDQLRWDLSYGVHVVMSQRGDDDMRQPALRQAWCSRLGMPRPTVLQQVHGNSISTLQHDGSTTDTCGDGLISRLPAASLGVFGADCPPLVVAAPDVLGIAHCGWRGTATGIVSQLIAGMQRMSHSDPATWNALIGPGIHPDDFEVDGPVLNARCWPAGCVRTGRPGHAWLDLQSAIAADCATCGVAHVARCPQTTSRSRYLRSHRRDGAGFPHLLVAWRSPCG
jgi:copper oxidase (laccase) domain-containing protein